MKNRSVLRFSELAQSAFSFLEKDGYLCVFSSPLAVRYESKDTYIEITHGERDFEVAISFGRKGTEERFSFTLFLRLVNPSLEKQLGERLADQPEQVSGCLYDLADALKSEGSEIIVGYEDVFKRMENVRWWDFKPDAFEA